jgi:hypothetical protein
MTRVFDVIFLVPVENKAGAVEEISNIHGHSQKAF